MDELHELLLPNPADRVHVMAGSCEDNDNSADQITPYVSYTGMTGLYNSC